MKKLLILSVTFMLALNIGQSFGQDNKNYASTTNPNKKEKRIEKRGDRRELRLLEGSKVSNNSMKNFKIDFSNANNVNWTRTPNYDIASFTLKGQELKAYYDSDSQLVGTTQYKTIEDLPEKGQKILRDKYKDYSIGKIMFFNNNDLNRSPMLLWGTEIVDQSSFFVELASATKKMVVYVDQGGNVKPFKQL
jgi:hypothetical protein